MERSEPGEMLKRLGRAFHLGEQGAYAIAGMMLVVAIVVALAGAGRLLWGSVLDWGSLEATIGLMDRLLYVLMLVEILHTVHASLRTGSLHFEPFLIVGLIACVRRVLVITLDTSQITQPDKFQVDRMPLFYASMTELALLGLLITVLIGSIWLGRRAKRVAPDDAAPA